MIVTVRARSSAYRAEAKAREAADQYCAGRSTRPLGRSVIITRNFLNRVRNDNGKWLRRERFNRNISYHGGAFSFLRSSSEGTMISRHRVAVESTARSLAAKRHGPMCWPSVMSCGQLRHEMSARNDITKYCINGPITCA